MELTLESERLLLSLPDAGLASAALDFHRRNTEHLTPWSPPKPAGFDTIAFWNEYVEKSQIAFLQGSVVRLWLREKANPEQVIGSVGFSQIFRGPFCNCVLGYQIDRAFEGKGLMSEALQQAISYMFVEQKLHRINANYRPENIRSGRLLARLGFHTDGFAPRYLFINGQWRDHIQTSLINDAFRPEWLLSR
jgi:ribosomal-protein-alanine N-acetyltransferase